MSLIGHLSSTRRPRPGYNASILDDSDGFVESFASNTSLKSSGGLRWPRFASTEG